MFQPTFAEAEGKDGAAKAKKFMAK